MPFSVQQLPKDRKQNVVTTGAVSGTDEKTLQQLLRPDQATLIENIFATEPGRIERRNGSKLMSNATHKKHKVIATCTTSETWTDNTWSAGAGTVSNNTTQFKNSGLGAKTATVSVDLGGIKYDFTDKDLSVWNDGSASDTGDLIEFWLYITTAEIAKMAADSSLYIRFFCDATPTTTNRFIKGIAKASLTNGWQKISTAKSGYGSYGSADWSAVTGMDMVYMSTGGTAPTSAMAWTIDDIRMVESPGTTTNSCTVYFDYMDNIHLIGYGNTLAEYNVSTNTITDIKNDFIGTLQDGVRYGAYAFTCTGTGERVHRISRILYFSQQTANFTVGTILTGATSGATAKIIAAQDSGAYGYLTLSDITGTFQDNEVITDNNSTPGSATTNGAMTYYVEELANAPYCNRLCIFEERLLAGDIVRGSSVDRSKIIASNQDTDGSVPYFTTWTVGTSATAGFYINYARAAAVKDLVVFDTGNQSGVPQILFVLYADGWAAYHKETIDSSGTLVQDIKTDFSQLNAGGERGAIATPYGIFFGSESGEFLVKRDGSWRNLSENWSRIPYLDQTNSDRIYLPENEMLLVSTRDDSSKNNVVYWFNLKTLGSRNVAWGKITGWAVARFLLDGRVLYGAKDTRPAITKLLPDNIYDDEGSDVVYRYKQPLNIGSPMSVKDTGRIDILGYLTPGYPVTISMDGITENGGEEEDVVSFTYQADDGGIYEEGYGFSGYGESGYGETGGPEGTVWTPAYNENKRAYGYMTYILNIEGSDKVPQVISLVSVDFDEYRPQRANLLT
jgi:hypothetical protein